MLGITHIKIAQCTKSAACNRFVTLIKFPAAIATLVVPMIFWWYGALITLFSLAHLQAKDIPSLLAIAPPVILAPFGLSGLLMTALGAHLRQPHKARGLIVAGLVALLWAACVLFPLAPLITLGFFAPLGVTGMLCLHRTSKALPCQ